MGVQTRSLNYCDQETVIDDDYDQLHYIWTEQ